MGRACGRCSVYRGDCVARPVCLGPESVKFVLLYVFNIGMG